MTEQPGAPPPTQPRLPTFEDIRRLMKLVEESPWSCEPEVVSPEEYRRRAADPLWTGEQSA